MPDTLGENSIDSTGAERQTAVARADVLARNGLRNSAVERDLLSNFHAEGEPR